MIALMESGTRFARPLFDSRAIEGLERSGASASGFGISGSMVWSGSDVSGKFD